MNDTVTIPTLLYAFLLTVLILQDYIIIKNFIKELKRKEK